MLMNELILVVSIKEQFSFGCYHGDVRIGMYGRMFSVIQSGEITIIPVLQ
jgi:hypothetical protein